MTRARSKDRCVCPQVLVFVVELTSYLCAVKLLSVKCVALSQVVGDLHANKNDETHIPAISAIDETSVDC